MKGPSRLGRLMIGAALRSFPRRFRRRHGDAMRRAAIDRLTHSAGDGRYRAWRLLVDMISAGFSERVAEAHHRWAWPEHRSPAVRQPARPWVAFNMTLRHSIRLFWRQPLFSATAVLALALGIGASLAIFTVADAVLLKPLPYADPGRLVMINDAHYALSPAEFVDYRSGASSFSRMEAMYEFLSPVQLRVGSGIDVVQGFSITPGMFHLLGREPALGRTFGDNETAGVVVLSHRLWQDRFGSDPRVVGRQIAVNGQAVTIVGVMPPDFVLPYRAMLGPSGFSNSATADLWLPFEFKGPRMVDDRGALLRNVRYLAAVGRLAPGRSIDQARAELTAVVRNVASTYHDINKDRRAWATSLQDQIVSDVRPALLLLLYAVALLMLTACANVANLVLARTTARQRELALRSALGAGRARLVLQIFTETLVLSSAASVVALLVVGWGIRALVALAPPEIPRVDNLRPDPLIIAAALAVALIAALLSGVIPAFLGTRGDVRQALHDGGRSSIGGRRRTRAILVVAEVGLAVVLAAGAILLGRSFVALLEVDPGFRSDHLLTLQMNIPARLQTPESRRQFYEALFNRLGSVPGVIAVGGTTRLPLGSTNVSSQVVVEGHEPDPAHLPEVELRRGLGDYFGAMGIPVLAGRAFNERDTATSLPVAVVNERAAHKLFPGEDPVGKRVRLASSEAWLTIVGVIGNVRHQSLDTEPSAELYVNGQQSPPVAPFIVVRTSVAPGTVTAAVRAGAREVDRELAIFDIRTMDQLRSQSVAKRRFLAVLAGLFSLVALALASAGVYGVMALSVAERTKEIGIRLALGARPAQLWTLIAGQGLTLVGAGVAVGLVLARLAVPFMSSQLFGVSATDPLTVALVPVVIIAMAALGCYAPARRAMKVDPIVAVRSE